MKKFLSFFAAVAFASAMVVGFTACKSNSDDDDDDEGDSKKSSKTEIVGNWDIVKMCLEDNCIEVAGSFNFESNGTFEISMPQTGYYADGEWSLKGNTLTANSNGVTEKIEIVKTNGRKIKLKGKLGGQSYTYYLEKNN